MKLKTPHITTFVALTGLASPAALATNGYFLHGTGIKAQGQAGVSIAQPQDALAAASNPAGTVWIGDRLDGGATLFSPDRSAKINGNGAGADGHYKANARKAFLIPDAGISKQLNDRVGVGLALYANGGMNTEYRHNPFAAYGSTGRAGVDFTQVFVTPSVAWKFTDSQSVGLGLNLVYQRFAAKGLNAFANPLFSAHSSKVTNRGHDSALGAGARLGWQGQLTDDLTIGATWASKIKAKKFDRYAGLFANGGSFDIPENYGAGLSYKLTPQLTLGADVQEIRYGHVRSVGRGFDAESLFAGNRFGAYRGQGFGWRDVTVYKFAASYALTQTLTLRGGYSHADQPIPGSQTFLNILAPGVIQDHASLGLSWRTGNSGELSAAYTHGFKKTVKGNSAIPQAFGGGDADLKMSQNIFGLGYGWTF